MTARPICVLACLLVACGRIAYVEKIRAQPLTWEEACIQQELRCINESNAGDTVVVPLFGVLLVTRPIDWELVIRTCSLQGDLCRSRIPKRTAEP